MSKLYVFGIGGSGSRVLKSLTMLLAAGMHANTERIIPMIIDTDVNNGDLDNFRDIIKSYNRIRRASHKEGKGTGFFRTKIDQPKELNISGSTYGTLAKMIDHATLSQNGFSMTKALTELLFGTKALNMDLEKGFLGSPNVGSIVLRDVVSTKGFREFTQGFKSGDRIFIISSIFGGTGAAGFPLLLNLFRDEESSMSHAAHIKNAVIGGISLLPYFDVDKDKYDSGESAINSDTFITKTKAALSYYNNYMTPNLDALFYIGDYRRSTYENHDGGTKQKNPANFIEFASALSILEFLNYEKSVELRGGLAKPIKYFEFGIGKDVPTIDLNQLGSQKSPLTKALVKFLFFNIYNTNHLQQALGNSKLAWHNTLGAPSNFGESELVKDLNEFASRYYYRWLYEMELDERHARRFKPFNLNISNKEELEETPNAAVSLNIDDNSMFNLVSGIKAHRKDNVFKKDKIAFDAILNEMMDKTDGKEDREAPLEQKFVSLMHAMANEIYETRFNN